MCFYAKRMPGENLNPFWKIKITQVSNNNECVCQGNKIKDGVEGMDLKWK